MEYFCRVMFNVLTPFRCVISNAAEFFYRFVVGLHSGGAFRFADGIAALFAEAFNRFDAPAGAAAGSADGGIANMNIHRIGVQLRELTQRNPTAAANGQAEAQRMNLPVSQ